MVEPGMTNIYWTQIKLRAAANLAIYLVMGSRSLYLCVLILLLDIGMFL